MTEIKMIDINQINPSEYNPRAISQDALDGLKKSIKTFGMPQPLIVNKRFDGTEVLVGGHQRCRAAAELGWKEVPVVYVSLSEKEEKALNVVLNNKHIEGFFTDELQVILEEIKLDFNDDFFSDLKLDLLVTNDSWESDIEAIDKIEANLDGINGKIKITCKPDDKDAILFFLKEKFLETSFEGVHIE